MPPSIESVQLQNDSSAMKTPSESLAQKGLSPTASELWQEDLTIEPTLTDAFDADSFETYSWNQKSVPVASRDGMRPLTYEDLAVPLSRPPMIEERFGATVSAYEKKLERDAIAVNAPPSPMHPLEGKVEFEPRPIDSIYRQGAIEQLVSMGEGASAHPVSNQPVMTSDVSSPRQNATFASNGKRETPPSLPVPEHPAVERTRQWITQPE